ncbi:unnamed protein product, partial [Polarella glacialis]
AGAPCAALARMAMIFLATGFITLYATALFFDDFDQVRMSPRLLRFMLVYFLVGLTFTALISGAAERREDDEGQMAAMVQQNNMEDSKIAGRIIHSTGAESSDQKGKEDMGDNKGPASLSDMDHFTDVCSTLGWQQVAPPWCTVPLDLASGGSLWWAASPLFSVLLPCKDDSGELNGRCRQFLQRWRKHIDGVVLLLTGLLLLALHRPCGQIAPIAFGNAELGGWGVCLLALLRRASPLVCDAWRGPLAHLEQPRGPNFSLAQCAVCLGELVVGDDVVRTPCGHDFHLECLEEWVVSKRYNSAGCPLCREPLVIHESTDPMHFLMAGDCLL